MVPLPVQDEEISEDETSEMGEMGDSSTCSGHAGKKFDSRKDQHEPFCLHGNRREDEGKDRIRIKHRISHQHAIDRASTLLQ